MRPPRTRAVTRLGAAAMALLALLVAGCRTPAGTEAVPPPAADQTGPAPAQTAPGVGDSGDPAAIGQPAPDFAVTDIDGVSHSLKDYRGRVVAIEFWATYCKDCTQRLREYESIYQANKRNGVDFLALSSDTGEAMIKGWREVNAVTIPLARMDDKTRAAFFGSEPFVTIPQTRIADSQGTIRYIFGPDSKSADVEGAIKRLLAERK
jgi:peroxiredoxin